MLRGAGYADSSHRPTSERSVVEDAHSVYRWLLERRLSTSTRAQPDASAAGRPVADAGAVDPVFSESSSLAAAPQSALHVDEDAADSNARAASARCGGGPPIAVWGHSLGTGCARMCFVLYVC